MAVPASTTAPLVDALRAHAASRPDAPAIRFEGSVTSYPELVSRIDAAAGVLAGAWGVRPGERVAWLGANHPGQLVLLFALARVGGILVPLNFRLSPAEWDTLVKECGATRVVHDDAWAAAAGELATRNGLASHAVAELDAPYTLPTAVTDAGSAESPVLLVFTSGTTRRAKAAVHTQANLLANMQIAAQVQRITPGDRVATMLPMFHVGGLCIQTLPALHAGAEVLLHARFAPDAAIDCFESQRPTLTLQVPPTMKALIEHPRWADADLTSLRAVWAGSSVLPAALVQAFHTRGLPVCNVYGATETGPFSIALPPEHAMAKVGSCGWPAPGVEARIDDPRDGVGELWIRGPNVIGSYWPNEPACDAQGWFHTGDLAAQDADGSYAIVGRAKDLIISGGENIHPAEIEALLAEHPGVLECAAFGMADAQWGEIVAVAVVPRVGVSVNEEELKTWLASRLARYKLPRRWFWLEALPKTALGKVQRQLLASSMAGGPR